MENQQGTIFTATDGKTRKSSRTTPSWLMKLVTGDLPYLQEVAQTGEDRLGALDGLLKLFYLDPVKRKAVESWFFYFEYDLENPPTILIRICRAGKKDGWENRLDFFPDHVQQFLNQRFNLYLQSDYRGYAVADNSTLKQIYDNCNKAVVLYEAPQPEPRPLGLPCIRSLRTKGTLFRPESPEVIQRRTKQAARKLLKQLGVKLKRPPRQQS